jgi:putative SOS response-associated peptidase YedK
MCGGYALAEPTEVLEDVFTVDLVGENLPGPSWNIRPTNQVPVVVDTVDAAGVVHRRLESARWSLIPSWVKDAPPKFSTFNARSEDAASKASWRDSVTSKRCLVPASGYYEWQVLADGSKQPFYIHAGDDGVFALAGLYEWWLDPSKAANDPTRWLLSATTLTKDSAPELSHIHDRNPVLLTPETLEAWIDPHIEGDESLLQAIALESDLVAAEAEFYKVDAAVGAVRNNSPELIRAI